MNLTICAEPSTRRCLLREVRAVCAGESCRLKLAGVKGADAATLAVTLRRPDGTLVASASGFSPVEGEPGSFAADADFATAPFAAWYGSVLGDGSDADGPPPRFEALARLEAYDADRVWVACDVPVVLRDLSGVSLVPAISGLLPPSMRLSTVDDLFAAVRAVLAAARVSVEESVEESDV